MSLCSLLIHALISVTKTRSYRIMVSRQQWKDCSASDVGLLCNISTGECRRPRSPVSYRVLLCQRPCAIVGILLRNIERIVIQKFDCSKLHLELLWMKLLISARQYCFNAHDTRSCIWWNDIQEVKRRGWARAGIYQRTRFPSLHTTSAMLGRCIGSFLTQSFSISANSSG